MWLHTSCLTRDHFHEGSMSGIVYCPLLIAPSFFRRSSCVTERKSGFTFNLLVTLQSKDDFESLSVVSNNSLNVMTLHTMLIVLSGEYDPCTTCLSSGWR